MSTAWPFTAWLYRYITAVAEVANHDQAEWTDLLDMYALNSAREKTQKFFEEAYN